MGDWVDVGPAPAVTVDGVHCVDMEGTPVALACVAGQWHAIEDICTHDGGPLSGGCLEGEALVCPRHGARFSVITGAALSPPAYEPVHTFPVRLVDGRLQIRDERW